MSRLLDNPKLLLHVMLSRKKWDLTNIDKEHKPIDKEHKPIDKEHKPIDKEHKPIDKEHKPIDKQYYISSVH